ncbi:MAG TPA: ABC transporter permease [Candidatus Sulfotelmatobacter sp.]|nr:ABC transporter permease [Candidatus Sulfotelmatobacter sp.]
MGTLLQDLRFGLRTLRKAPGFTLIAVIVLALGIGANTAMFSIVNAVLLRPLPYAEPERLLKLYTSMPQFRDASVSYPNFLDWQQRSRSFEMMAAYRGDTFNVTGQATPERLRGRMASASIFPALNLKPILGRTFSAEEDSRGGAPVVVLTSSFWKAHFGSDRQVVGRTITLNEKLYTIIGVVPSDNVLWQNVSVVVPIGQWSEPLFWNRGVGMGMRVLGRLKTGVSTQQAQSELNGVAAALAQEYPKENKEHGIYAVSLREDLTGDVRTPLLVLLGAVGFVLLIACANVANLLLARASSRRREMAIRGALGATRSRIARQLLTESMLLAVVGALLGLALAMGLNSVFVAKITTQLPRAGEIHLDSSVLIFTALIALLASLLFGIMPALRSGRSDLNKALKEGARGNTSRHGLLRALVVVEVALGLVLTASAGLMVRTMSRLWNINPGFDPQNVLTFGVAGSPAVHGAPAAIRNGFSQTLDQLRSVPGVKAVSVVFGAVPMQGDSELPYWVEGRPKPAEQSKMDLALFYGVDPDYLNVMGIRLLRGRFLSPQDNEKSPCAVAVDEEFVRKAFPGQDPLGQHINLELVTMKCEVVGVVGHVKHWGLDTDATAKVHSQMYIAFRQFPDGVMDLASTDSSYAVRTSGDPYAPVPALKKAISGINGKMVVYGEESMQETINNSLAARRFTRLLLGTFAILALVLAGVGIYGVVSYTVAQGTHEIGVRMALGADRGIVLGTVLKGAMGMALLGIVLGAAAAFAATRVMKDLLFGVSATDPFTFTAVALLLAGVTLLASYIPALRATKVDPIVALRYE